MESAEKKQMCVRLMSHTCKVKKISREVKGTISRRWGERRREKKKDDVWTSFGQAEKKPKQNKTHDGPSCDILQTSSDDDDGGGIKIQYMNE